MANRLDVLLVHGIAVNLNGQTYYSDFVNSLRKLLPVDMDINFHPIVWNDLLYKKETQIYRWMSGLRWDKLRWIGCTLIGDILAYAPPEGIPGPGDFYYDVNKLLEAKYDEIAKAYPKSRKVIISHSLGTQISFSFCFRREVDLLVTFGSPILYFSVRFKDYGKFPDATLHRMINFYNPFDPISTVVSRNPSLRQCRDIKIMSWNPLNMAPMHAHSAYWSSSEMVERMAESLKSMA